MSLAPHDWIVMSALTPKAAATPADWPVRFGPRKDIDLGALVKLSDHGRQADNAEQSA
jgi:hypothetical protein